MAWVYSQSTGQLSHEISFFRAEGYSGCSKGKNCPDRQFEQNMGPIPRGVWAISGPPYDSAEHGPFILRLTPGPTTDVGARGGFLVHGDSRTAPGTASKGCIILPRPAREAIWHSDDRVLIVVE